MKVKLSELLEETLEAEKVIVRATCHNVLREEMYGEKLQDVVIFHLENFARNIQMRTLDRILEDWNAIKKDYGEGVRGSDEEEFSLLISYLDRMDAVITLTVRPQEELKEADESET